MNICLEWFEVSRAALVGVSRSVEAMRRGCQNKRMMPDEWSVHILGALGECAFAKATNRYWNGSVNTFKSGGDIGDAIQIRTRSKHSYDLIVRNDDRDDDVFVLVTGGPHDFTVHGWTTGKSAKQEKYKANYGNYGEAFFVPSRELRPVERLIVGGGA